MKTQFLFLSGIMLLASCNSNSASDNTSTENKTEASASTGDPKKENGSVNGDASTVSFMLNGQSAITAAANPDDTKQTSSLYSSTKQFTVYLEGYIAPDVNRHQLSFFVNNFNCKTGEITNATAQFSRRDESRKEYIYGNRKEGSFKLTITKCDTTSGSTAYSRQGLVSGTFEGDLSCETCFDAASKTSPFSQTQHITSGKFENVKLMILK